MRFVRGISWCLKFRRWRSVVVVACGVVAVTAEAEGGGRSHELGDDVLAVELGMGAPGKAGCRMGVEDMDGAAFVDVPDVDGKTERRWGAGFFPGVVLGALGHRSVLVDRDERGMIHGV